MIIFITKSRLVKKLILAFSLLVFCTAGTVIFNYRNIGVFKFQDKKLPIYSVGTKDKKVAITFDSSWGEDNTDKILDVLNKYNVKATFFIIGRWAEEYPGQVKKIYKNGHEIGNHTDKHPDMTLLSKEKIIKEVAVADARIMALTGFRPELFRCPEGSYNDLVIDTVNGTNHICIQWDVDSIDWKGEGTEKEYKRVIDKTKAGSIILFHNNGINTPETLPKVIDKLKTEGYGFVKVSELIYKDNYYIDNKGRQISD